MSIDEFTKSMRDLGHALRENGKNFKEFEELIREDELLMPVLEYLSHNPHSSHPEVTEAVGDEYPGVVVFRILSSKMVERHSRAVDRFEDTYTLSEKGWIRLAALE